LYGGPELPSTTFYVSVSTTTRFNGTLVCSSTSPVTTFDTSLVQDKGTRVGRGRCRRKEEGGGRGIRKEEGGREEGKGGGENSHVIFSYHHQEWQEANWLQQDNWKPTSDCDMYQPRPSPLFRTLFTLPFPPGTLTKTTLYFVGLGYGRVFLNGHQLRSQIFLDTPWSNFNHTVYYSAITISENFFQEGDNVLGVELGNGYWNPLPLRFWGSLNLRNFLTIGTQPVFKLRLSLESVSGVRIMVDTRDPKKWRVGGGAIQQNNVYLGEVYNASVHSEILGWSTPAFTGAKNWETPVVSPPENVPKGRLEVLQIPPVESTEKIIPVSTWVQKKSNGSSVVMVDFGINFSGIIEISIPVGTCSFGQNIEFRYGEILYPDRSLNFMTSVAGQIKSGNGGPCAPKIAFQSDVYFCARDRNVTWYRPTFTWHAFRFLEVSGPPEFLEMVSVSSIFGIRLQNSVRATSTFDSSHPLLNEIHGMIVNSFRNNFISGLQTDCPHRERFGYGGDVHASAEAAILNFDMEAFYVKRILDFMGDQRENGMRQSLPSPPLLSSLSPLPSPISPLPPSYFLRPPSLLCPHSHLLHPFSLPLGGFTETAPFNGIADASLGGQSGPIGWQAAFLKLLKLRKIYSGHVFRVEPSGNVLPVDYLGVYEPAYRFASFLEKIAISENFVISAGLGDWSSIAPRDVNFTSTVFLYEIFSEFSALSEEFGYTGNATKFHNLAQETRKSLLRNFYNPTTGCFSGCSQGDLAFALNYNLLEGIPTEKSKVIQTLLNKISESNFFFTTGMWGTKFLLSELSENNSADIAFRLFTNEAYPSFGYMLGRGATSLWEVWEWSSDTYSHDHAMFGGADEFLWRVLGGVEVVGEKVSLEGGERQGFEDRQAGESGWEGTGEHGRGWTTVGLGKFVLKPHVLPQIRWVNVTLETRYGNLQVFWEIKNSTRNSDYLRDPEKPSISETIHNPTKFSTQLEVTYVVPPNTEAELFLPENFSTTWKTLGTVGSGTYNFRVVFSS
jgi:alpha-L-rhamnosidase